MDNQHKQISGYRDLNADEIALMNEAKALEAQVLAFQKRVWEQIDMQVCASLEDSERAHQAEAFRWLNIGRTDIEKGIMATVRAIAQPQPKQ